MTLQRRMRKTGYSAILTGAYLTDAYLDGATGIDHLKKRKKTK